MVLVTHTCPARRQLRTCRRLMALAAALMLGACAQLPTPGVPDALSLSDAPAQEKGKDGTPPQSDLTKATEYWGKKFSENSRDLIAALNYARNLKAMGEKQRAMAVLQQAAIFHGNSRELAGEYGRLALDLDQVSVASRLLAAADDPVHPDWRIISARGTALAKQGKYSEAIPFYERALTLAHDQPSLLSNLALAQAMSGEPAKAEVLLRQAAAADGNSPKIRQNLALVLGLQGKYDEAKAVGSLDIPIENAAENTNYLRQIVKLEPKLSGEAAAKVADAEAEKLRAQAVAAAAKMPAKPEAVAPAGPDVTWAAAKVKTAPVTKEAAPAKSETAAVSAPAVAGDDEPLAWATHLKAAAVLPPASEKGAPSVRSEPAQEALPWSAKLSAPAAEKGAKSAQLEPIELPVRKPDPSARAGKDEPKAKPPAQETSDASPAWKSNVTAKDRGPTWTPQVALSTAPGN